MLLRLASNLADMYKFLPSQSVLING